MTFKNSIVFHVVRIAEFLYLFLGGRCGGERERKPKKSRPAQYPLNIFTLIPIFLIFVFCSGSVNFAHDIDADRVVGPSERTNERIIIISAGQICRQTSVSGCEHFGVSFADEAAEKKHSIIQISVINSVYAGAYNILLVAFEAHVSRLMPKT